MKPDEVSENITAVLLELLNKQQDDVNEMQKLIIAANDGLSQGILQVIHLMTNKPTDDSQ